MKVLSVFFCLVCFCVSAIGQGLQARYDVTDVIHKENSRIEVWKIVETKKKGITTYKVTKKTFAKEPLKEIEIHGFWTRETRPTAKATYSREFLTVHPIDMHPGESSFGYVELRDVASDKVIDNWPTFYHVEEIVGGKRATFRVLLSDGWIMKVVKDYENDDTYFFPIRESRVLFRGNIIRGHLIFEREN